MAEPVFGPTELLVQCADGAASLSQGFDVGRLDDCFEDHHGGLQRELVILHRPPCGWAPMADRNWVMVSVGSESADMLDGAPHLP
eukprot:5729629-Pyramimonas_sp.AAC.1